MSKRPRLRRYVHELAELFGQVTVRCAANLRPDAFRSRYDGLRGSGFDLADNQ